MEKTILNFHFDYLKPRLSCYAWKQRKWDCVSFFSEHIEKSLQFFTWLETTRRKIWPMMKLAIAFLFSTWWQTLKYENEEKWRSQKKSLASKTSHDSCLIVSDWFTFIISKWFVIQYELLTVQHSCRVEELEEGLLLRSHSKPIITSKTSHNSNQETNITKIEKKEKKN